MRALHVLARCRLAFRPPPLPDLRRDSDGFAIFWLKRDPRAPPPPSDFLRPPPALPGFARLHRELREQLPHVRTLVRARVRLNAELDVEIAAERVLAAREAKLKKAKVSTAAAPRAARRQHSAKPAASRQRI